MASCQGKARPWILLSTPVLFIGMIMLFTVPEGSDWFKAAWIFISYNLFYSIGYTAYSTSHTLLVPLSTKNDGERSRFGDKKVGFGELEVVKGITSPALIFL